MHAVNLNEMLADMAFQHSRDLVTARSTGDGLANYLSEKRILSLGQTIEGRLNMDAQCERYDRDESISNAGYDLAD